MASDSPNMRIRQLALFSIVAPIVGVAVNYFTLGLRRPLPMLGVYAMLLLFVAGLAAGTYALLKRNQDPVRPPTIPALVGMVLSGGMLAFACYAIIQFILQGS